MERIATIRTEARIPGLVGLLADAGIDAIVLKGPVTRQRYYAPGEDRPTGDVDLLVHPRSFRRAIRTLTAAGHQRVDRNGHSDTFNGPGGFTDLHLALPYTTVAPRRAFRILTEHITPVAVAGQDVPALDTAAHVVHLALHAAQNGFRPEHRSLEEWRRGHQALSSRDAAEAEAIAGQLGARAAWSAAANALRCPQARAELVAGLPLRKPKPTPRILWSFATSPIPLIVKIRATGSHVRSQLSDQTIAVWRADRGLPPVTPGTSAIGLAKAHRIIVASCCTLVGGRR